MATHRATRKVILKETHKAMLPVGNNGHKAKAVLGVVPMAQQAETKRAAVRDAWEAGRTCRRCWRECPPSRSLT